MSLKTKTTEKPPYLMSREEWEAEREKCHIQHGQMNLTKASASQEIARITSLEYLCYGVGEWIYNKAFTEEWALEALEYSYDTYEMIIKKAKEEGKI